MPDNDKPIYEHGIFGVIMWEASVHWQAQSSIDAPSCIFLCECAMAATPLNHHSAKCIVQSVFSSPFPLPYTLSPSNQLSYKLSGMYMWQ